MKKYLLIDIFEREIGLPRVFDTAEAAREAMVNTIAEILKVEPSPILQALNESGCFIDEWKCEVGMTYAWANDGKGKTDLWIIELDTETWGCSV